MLVHGLNLFDSITYLFPVRGHYYLPNDQDFPLFQEKSEKWKELRLQRGGIMLFYNQEVKRHLLELSKSTNPSFLT